MIRGLAIRGLAFALGLASLAHGLYIPAKARLAQVLLHHAWTQTQSGTPTKPWPWADTHPAGRLSIGSKSFIVLRGSHGSAMAFAPGLMDGIATPVISAHRDTHFAVLADAKPGDPLVWETPTTKRTYRIETFTVVDTPRASIPTDALVLTTCWPLDGLTRGSQRLVVTARPVADEVRA